MSFDASTIEYRNAKYTKHGNIEVEINHPDYGWIPFAAVENDCEPHCRDLFARLNSGSDVAAYDAASDTTVYPPED